METTSALLQELKESLTNSYKQQLDSFGKMMPNKTKGILMDGFRDGLNAGISHVCEMLGVTVTK